MVDWLTWPADLLLSAGGVLAGWFASKGTPSYTALRMGFGVLVLATIVSLLAYLPSLIGYLRSRRAS